MNQKIVGRKVEQEILEEIFTAREAHFLAITGRRRVGKTHLIKTYFAQKLNFDFSGILNATTAQQLNNFYYSIQQQLKPKKKVHAPANWIEAFQLLSQCLEAKNKKRIVVFIDELPWLDTHKSNFTAALDWFWNSWAAHKNVLLIVCGSSTSWMMEKIVNSKGGLHNRITKRIDLSPFTLNETEDFFSYKGYSFSRYHILQLYMAMGGIPHYLKEIKKGESAAQAIHRICFQKSGLLVNEFDNLYSALFKNSEQHIQVIFALSKKQNGLTRNEILAKLKTKDGGTFTKVLAELEMCHFVLAQPPFGKSKKETVYRLIDEFSVRICV